MLGGSWRLGADWLLRTLRGLAESSEWAPITPGGYLDHYPEGPVGRPRLPVRMIGYPYTSILGAAAMLAIMATTWWVEGMRVALIAGLPWLAALTVAYFLMRNKWKKTF